MALTSIDNFLEVTDYSATSVRTMKNSAGQIGFAPHNLILASEDFSDSNWTKTATTVTSNAAAAPDGSITADKISHTSTSAELRQNTTVVDGQSYTFGILAKYIDSQWMRVATDQSGPPYGTWFDIQNGVLGTDNSGGASITALADGWYYLSIPNTANGTSFYSSIFLTGADASDVETSGTEAYIWGAHLYENGLAGMFDVPEDQRALASLTKYLPNTSTTAARFLPRRDNHEYIDGAWVKGLKVESEARTNLVVEALEFDNAAWSKQNTATLAQDATGPDGQTSAVTLVDSGATGTGAVQIFESVTVATTTAYTFSIYAKADQLDWIALRTEQFTTPANSQSFFDLTNGVTGTIDAAHTAHMEDVGNGWYRCGITFTTDATDTSGNVIIRVSDGDTDITVDLDGTSSILIYGAQFEAGSTPSSLIPTYGATRTRTAETFTQKEDKIIWPNTTYVDGTELAIASGQSGTITSGTTPWYSNENLGQVSISSDVITYAASSWEAIRRDYSLTVGSTYEITLDVTRTSGTLQIFVDAGATSLKSITATGSYTLVFTTASSSILQLGSGGFNGTVEITSLKEINPRALAVVMHGYMTYADTGSFGEATLWQVYEDANNRIKAKLSASLGTGEIDVIVVSNGTSEQSFDTTSQYSPGINVPFKLAVRHLDDALQVATEGVASTEQTATAVGLPDLSATQAEWFYDFMGHISFVGVGQEASADRLDSTNGPTTLTTATGGSFLA